MYSIVNTCHMVVYCCPESSLGLGHGAFNCPWPGTIHDIYMFCHVVCLLLANSMIVSSCVVYDTRLGVMVGLTAKNPGVILRQL